MVTSERPCLVSALGVLGSVCDTPPRFWGAGAHQGPRRWESSVAIGASAPAEPGATRLTLWPHSFVFFFLNFPLQPFKYGKTILGCSKARWHPRTYSCHTSLGSAPGRGRWRPPTAPAVPVPPASRRAHRPAAAWPWEPHGPCGPCVLSPGAALAAPPHRGWGRALAYRSPSSALCP